MPRKIQDNQGTGSKPPLENGLQRKTLQIVIKSPFNGPYFFIASSAYSEHVGVNLQTGGFNGEINF